MIVRNAITALSALHADGALKTADNAMLERLRGLAHDCVTVIAEETVRRNPEPTFEKEEWEVIQTRRVHALVEAAKAERRKIFEDQETTLQEAIALCASKPDLQARIKAVLEDLRERL